MNEYVSSPAVNPSYSRMSKVEFPRLDGRDVQGWIYRCEQFFVVDETPLGPRVKIAAIHLEGKALMWHQTHMKAIPIGQWPPWRDYR